MVVKEELDSKAEAVKGISGDAGPSLVAPEEVAVREGLAGTQARSAGRSRAATTHMRSVPSWLRVAHHRAGPKWTFRRLPFTGLEGAEAELGKAGRQGWVGQLTNPLEDSETQAAPVRPVKRATLIFLVTLVDYSRI
jgi:hypothetical protein